MCLDSVNAHDLARRLYLLPAGTEISLEGGTARSASLNAWDMTAQQIKHLGTLMMTPGEWGCDCDGSEEYL